MPAALKVADYADVEAVVQTTLNPAQQSVIVGYFPGARAQIVYALGRNPATAQRLAGITDPIEFALAVRDLQGRIQMTKKAPPPAERKPVSTGSVLPSDQTLAALEKEAERTGDRSKLVAYKRSLRQAASQ